jgi:hypothetical protein
MKESNQYMAVLFYAMEYKSTYQMQSDAKFLGRSNLLQRPQIPTWPDMPQSPTIGSG